METCVLRDSTLDPGPYQHHEFSVFRCSQSHCDLA
jgi:hypothetical protein